MSKRYSGKSFKDSSLMKKPKLSLKEKRKNKKTLESEDFYILVKQNVEKTNKILKSSNQ